MKDVNNLQILSNWGSLSDIILEAISAGCGQARGCGRAPHDSGTPTMGGNEQAGRAISSLPPSPSKLLCPLQSWLLLPRELILPHTQWPLWGCEWRGSHAKEFLTILEQSRGGIDLTCGFTTAIQCAKASKHQRSLSSDVQFYADGRGLESALSLPPQPSQFTLWWLPGHMQSCSGGTDTSRPRAVTLDFTSFHQRWGLAVCLNPSESTR